MSKLLKKSKSNEDIETILICDDLEPLIKELDKIHKRFKRNGWNAERVSEKMLEIEGNTIYWIK